MEDSEIRTYEHIFDMEFDEEDQSISKYEWETKMDEYLKVFVREECPSTIVYNLKPLCLSQYRIFLTNYTDLEEIMMEMLVHEDFDKWYGESYDRIS